MNQIELYLKYARVIEMCKGTALEDKPFLGVKVAGDTFDGHPHFDMPPERYEFAIAILEGRPVFVGNKIYAKTPKEIEYTVTGKWAIAEGYCDYPHCEIDNKKFSWQPPKPKRRIVLEETGETRKPKIGDYVFDNGNLCLCRKPERWGKEHEIWHVVEDTGDKP